MNFLTLNLRTMTFKLVKITSRQTVGYENALLLDLKKKLNQNETLP